MTAPGDPESASESEPSGEADGRGGVRTGPDTGAPAAGFGTETDVPPGADAHVCDRCGQPFAREEYRTLHLGLAHYDRLSGAERERFEAAYAEERADIRRFRIVALGLLVLLYFGFLFAYAFFA